MLDRAVRRMTSAAWFLAACVVAATFRPQGSSEAVCQQPGALETRAGFTQRVTCDQAPDSAAPLVGPARLLFGQKLDLNCASPQALQVVSGVGPTRAEALRATRCESAFVSLEDALRAHGIGPATLARLAAVSEVVHPSQRSISCDPGCRRP